MAAHAPGRTDRHDHHGGSGLSLAAWRTTSNGSWREQPTRFGKWQTAYGRHRRWSADGTCMSPGKRTARPGTARVSSGVIPRRPDGGAPSDR
ncbi:transposase [Streptomyces smyrnaeus]|uniref:Transposase n=1 Tax=Streptomyces smyrnaeus TaxID=1387713 RepID=A0ABS3XVJ6_9ACTN|nr:transposase [Streptomyces smyrnaeus]